MSAQASERLNHSGINLRAAHQPVFTHLLSHQAKTKNKPGFQHRVYRQNQGRLNSAILRPARTKSIVSVIIAPSVFSSAVDSSRTQPPSPNCGIWNGTSPSKGLNSIRTSCQIPSSFARSAQTRRLPEAHLSMRDKWPVLSLLP